jgi:hypothetical protein
LRQTLEFMNANFGKSGAYYYWISRGVDDRPVRANRIRKSIGAENTFSVDLTTFDAMAAELRPLIDKVWRHCEGTGNRGRTVTLNVKFFDFEIITRSRSVPTVVSSRDDLESLAIALLQAEMPFPKSVCACWACRCPRCKRRGTTMSNLSSICPSDAARGCGLQPGGRDGAESFAWLDVPRRGLSDFKIVDDRFQSFGRDFEARNCDR